jgi:hypothetical protein
MRKLQLSIPVFVIVSALAVTAQAATILVPDSGSGILTIQDGINAAVTGDEVVVAPGTYGSINFMGKGITVRSESGPDVTFIEPTAPAADIVVLQSGEGNDSVLRGFTVRKAMLATGVVISGASPIIEENVIELCSDMFTGGGFLLGSSNAIIRNNIIRNNGVTRAFAGGTPTKGGGLYVTGTGSPLIENNFILDNGQSCGVGFCIDAYGAGIYASGGSPRIVGNVFAGNHTAPAAQEWGGAIYITGTADAVIANNTFYGNAAQYDPMLPSKHGGGALYIADGNSTLLVANNIIQANADFGVLCASTSVDVTFQTNSLFGNGTSEYEDCPAGTGDLFVDAQMLDPVARDFHLSDSSPLMDAGSVVASGLPVLDIYGDPRVADGDGSGTTEVDIGADELPAAPTPGWGAADTAEATHLGQGGPTGSRAANALGMLALPVLFGLVWVRVRRRR